jgi:aspartate racemase
MKKIGLIGGLTWVSTLEYYRLLNELINEREGGSEAAEIILYSVNFGPIKKMTEAGDWNGISVIIRQAARVLEKAGADCLMLGANTMHKIAPEIQASISIPLIHIATITAHAINKQNMKRIALLGTKYTMQLDFYKNALAQYGIETLVPGEKDIEFINTSIYTELGKNIFLPDTRQQYVEIINELAGRGAEGVILGCTEIPMLIKQTDSSIPVFDTTKLHAMAAVEFALGG